MNPSKKNSEASAINPVSEKSLSEETHEDLDEFNATKKTIQNLLDYKRNLLSGSKDLEKIAEIKKQAMDAINNFFNDIKKSPNS